MPQKGEKHNAETLQKISERLKGREVWNKDKPWSNFEKEKIGIGKKGILNWVNDKRLQEIAKRDYAAAKICEKEGIFKPAIILYAGLLEALLRYKIDEKTSKSFKELIKEALKRELIGEQDADKMSVIKDFRNNVHIYKEISDEFEISAGISQLSRELCNSVIKTLKDK